MHPESTKKELEKELKTLIKEKRKCEKTIKSLVLPLEKAKTNLNNAQIAFDKAYRLANFDRFYEPGLDTAKKNLVKSRGIYEAFYQNDYASRKSLEKIKWEIFDVEVQLKSMNQEPAKRAESRPKHR